MTVQVGLLSSLRVCLVGHYVPGPLAAYLLHNLGAEVIKVEPPFHDLLRHFPPYVTGPDGTRMGAWFRALNAGFKSIVIDFRKPGGGDLLARLLAHCDILIDGNRPGYLEKVLGTHPEQVHPELIYVPISAYGQVGPLRNVAGHDGNALAMAGNLSYTAPGQEGLPAPFSAPVADILSAHTAAMCALAGCIGRGKVQGPRTIDTSMLHSAFFLNQMQVAAMNVAPDPPRAGMAWMNGGLANYAPYPTADGQSIFFGPIEPELFANFCRTAQREDLIDLLYADNDTLKAELKTLFATRTRAEWETLLAGTDCCFTPIDDLSVAMDNPQVQALGLVQPVHDPRLGPLSLATFPAGFGPGSTPPKLPDQAPLPGEHTDEILEILRPPAPSAPQPPS